MTNFSLTFALSVICGVCVGMPANPEPQKYEQPDGSQTPHLYLNGDEYYSWLEDRNGYTVIRDHNGWYVYAKKVAGALITSGARVGHINPRKRGLLPHLTDEFHDHQTHAFAEFDEEVEHRNLMQVPSAALCNFEGTKQSPCKLLNLAVLVRFSNHKNRVLPDRAEYDVLFNNNGPTSGDTAPTGSVSDVFLENSFGRFKMQTVVTPWIDVRRSEVETAGDNRGMARPHSLTTWGEALTNVDNRGDIDLRDFDQDGDLILDAFVIVHSGAGSETGGNDCETNADINKRIWSHAFKGGSHWFLSKDGLKPRRYYVTSGVWGKCPPDGAGKKWAIARLAVMAHECGHFLGLPDLYDARGGNGVGRFDLMGQCWGWKRDQLMPPLLGAYTRMALRWVQVVDITSPGTYTIGPGCSSDKVYRINHNMPEGEFFLIENKYGCGFDAELNEKGPSNYRGGIAIWHVDQGKTMDHINHYSRGYPGDGSWPKNHYHLSLVQADGAFDFEKGENQGDRLDLFKHDPSGQIEDSDKIAYMIGPSGIVKNGGGKASYPNTKAYSTGKEVDTGVFISVGPVAKKMQVAVSFDGKPPSGGGSLGGSLGGLPAPDSTFAAEGEAHNLKLHQKDERIETLDGNPVDSVEWELECAKVGHNLVLHEKGERIETLKGKLPPDLVTEQSTEPF